MSHPEQPLSVAIVGGGVAGVATCKALAARGIPCTLFEARPSVGGLWVDNYPGAVVQAPPSQYEYADAAFGRTAATLATAAEVVEYCEAYVRTWKLESHLRLGTRVERVAQRPGGGFVVETRPASGPSGAEVEAGGFSHVVICTGMFSNTGRRLDVPGLDKFEGLLLHSSERRDDAAEFRERRVLVVGGGKSAQDAAAAAAAAGATSVAMALRRPHLLVPFRVFGLIPYHWIFANSVVLKILPVYPGRPVRLLGRAARLVTAPLRGLIWRTLNVVMLLHYRLPLRLWPRESLEREMMGAQGTAIFSKEYIRGARSGAIDVQVAQVARAGSRSVTLRHTRTGTEEELPVDTLIVATGFADCHPFLDAPIVGALDRQPDGLPLYRHIVPPAVPGLLFVGRAASFTNPLTASVQGAWVGELLEGRVELPDAAAMRADSDRWAEALAGPPLSDARRHLIALQGNRYADELLRDMGVRHLARYGGPFGPIANTFLPVNPANFRNAVQPPHARTRRRLAPPLWLKAVVVGAVVGCVKVVRGSG